MKPAKTLLIILSIALTGCGGGDSSPIYAPPTMEIKGQAVDGLILGAYVSVYSVHDDGSKNTLLGTARTSQDDGSWIMPGIVDQEQKVYIEVCGGYYIEEATGQQKYLNEDECLSSYDSVDGIHSEGRSYTVSGITHMAAAYTKNRIKNDNVPLDLAILQGATAFTAVTNIDPHRTIFKDITSALYERQDYTRDINAFTYSIISAGVSALVNDINLASGGNHRSIDLWQRFYQDLVHDGLINGRGESGALKIGSKTLDGNLFRTEVMRSARRFVTKSDRVKIQFTDNSLQELDDILNGIAINSHVIYNNQKQAPIDDQPPITQWDRSYVGGAFIASTYNLSFIEDNAITKIVVTLVDAENEEYELEKHIGQEAVQQSLKADNTLQVALKPRNYATGDAVLSVEVRDDRNNEALTTTRLTFVNDSPAIMLDEQTSAISSKTVTLSGTYSLPTSHTQMAFIEVSYMEDRELKKEIATITGNQWLVRVAPAEGGEITFAITACDTIGNCFDTDQKVLIDNKLPKIEREQANYRYDVFGNHRYTTTLNISSFKNGVETWPPEADHITRLHYPYGKHRMGNIDRDIEDLKEAKTPYIAFNFIDPDDNGSYHTPSKELTITEEYYTARLHSNQFTFYGENTEIDTNLNLISTKTIAPTLAYENDKDRSRTYILPLTTETLGEDFVFTHPDTTHIIRYIICDEAGNCTWTAYTFSAVFEEPVAIDIQLIEIANQIKKPLQYFDKISGNNIDLFKAVARNNTYNNLLIRPVVNSKKIKLQFANRIFKRVFNTGEPIRHSEKINNLSISSSPTISVIPNNKIDQWFLIKPNEEITVTVSNLMPNLPTRDENEAISSYTEIATGSYQKIVSATISFEPIIDFDYKFEVSRDYKTNKAQNNTIYYAESINTEQIKVNNQKIEQAQLMGSYKASGIKSIISLIEKHGYDNIKKAYEQEKTTLGTIKLANVAEFFSTSQTINIVNKRNYIAGSIGFSNNGWDVTVKGNDDSWRQMFSGLPWISTKTFHARWSGSIHHLFKLNLEENNYSACETRSPPVCYNRINQGQLLFP